MAKLLLCIVHLFRLCQFLNFFHRGFIDFRFLWEWRLWDTPRSYEEWGNQCWAGKFVSSESPEPDAYKVTQERQYESAIQFIAYGHWQKGKIQWILNLKRTLFPQSSIEHFQTLLARCFVESLGQFCCFYLWLRANVTSI